MKRKIDIGMKFDEVLSIIGKEHFSESVLSLGPPAIKTWGYTIMNGNWVELVGFDEKNCVVNLGSVCIR
jgi:hypothetical protein